MVAALVSGDSKEEKNDSDLDKVLADVLGVRIVEQKSFVEMGGDSALAITVLYRLRSAGLCSSEVTAWHILAASSVSELRAVLRGDRCLKRPRHDQEQLVGTRFLSQAIGAMKGHVAIKFKACVDAAPLVHGSDVYGACQGGIIQRIVNGKEPVSHHDLRLNIHADMIIAGDCLIVCGYKTTESSGVVRALSLDLSTIIWTRRLSGIIKSSPVQVGTSIFVLAGTRLHLLDARDGDVVSTLDLPSCSESKPAVVWRSGSPLVVYAFSSWDAGLAIIEADGSKVADFSDVSCPVHADLLAHGDAVVVCDVRGCIHHVHAKRHSARRSQISNHPVFSGPVMMDFSRIVFGCHDGIVRCLQASDFTKCWEYDAKSVVYSNPLVTDEQSVVICTIAGDVIRLENGNEVWRRKVDNST